MPSGQDGCNLNGHSLGSAGSNVCRICHTNTSREPMISPCRCKGALAYVHLSCLERWLNQSCRTYCELCNYRFNAVKTLRYRWYVKVRKRGNEKYKDDPRAVSAIGFHVKLNSERAESLRIWIRHPRNRRHIQADLLVLSILTIVTAGLISICVFGMRYFVIEGKKLGISRLWTRGAIRFFLAVVILGYVTSVYLLVKDQVSPWYRWWRNTVNVKLVDHQPRKEPNQESFPGYQDRATLSNSELAISTPV